MPPPENGESCSSALTALSPFGRSNRMSARTVLPGLMSFRNAPPPLPLLTSMSAELSALNLRPLASNTYWLESSKVWDSLPMLVTFRCSSVKRPCALVPSPIDVSPTDARWLTRVMTNSNLPSRPLERIPGPDAAWLDAPPPPPPEAGELPPLPELAEHPAMATMAAAVAPRPPGAGAGAHP